MKILVTGGAGFVGSHVCEYYAKQGHEVVAYDNLSRAKLLHKPDKNAKFNWDFLSQYTNIRRVQADILDTKKLGDAAVGSDAIIHTAAQTAVTTSVTEPATDFATNAQGTFNVLEAARTHEVAQVLYCSTNKVYGDNVNQIKVHEQKTRYAFDERFRKGIPEIFDVDLCEHTPYGCSKLTGDLYMQDYAHLYGIKTGVFRMSCIYGTRQFGVEDQGWVAWFTIATIMQKPVTIFGDGKQVRDVLCVTDLVEVYDRFIKSKLKHGVFNIGGGSANTMSLHELLDMLRKMTGKDPALTYQDWRPSDQKVYISDITNAINALGWKPKISPEQGVQNLVNWVTANKAIFK
jgi:CDP-paratose 2-epimerase